jgi:hypothetical protein
MAGLSREAVVLVYLDLFAAARARRQKPAKATQRRARVAARFDAALGALVQAAVKEEARERAAASLTQALAAD